MNIEREIDAIMAAKAILRTARRAGGDFATLERVYIHLNYAQFELEDMAMEDLARRVAESKRRSS